MGTEGELTHTGARLPYILRQTWAETALRRSGDLFFTWQHDIRWVAAEVRNEGGMRSAKPSPQGIWELTKRPTG